MAASRRVNESPIRVMPISPGPKQALIDMGMQANA